MIIDYLKQGKENALSREALCYLTGWSDRRVRKAIEYARREGLLIINDQDGSGYYLSDDIDAIEKQYWRNNSRFLAIACNQKYLRKPLREAGRL